MSPPFPIIISRTPETRPYILEKSRKYYRFFTFFSVKYEKDARADRGGASFSARTLSRRAMDPIKGHPHPAPASPRPAGCPYNFRSRQTEIASLCPLSSHVPSLLARFCTLCAHLGGRRALRALRSLALCAAILRLALRRLRLRRRTLLFAVFHTNLLLIVERQRNFNVSLFRTA